MSTTTPDIQHDQAQQQIGALRGQIDQVDSQIIELVAQRCDLSRQVGILRIAAGGPRLSLRRENQIISTFSAALGTEGTALAMVLLRAGRGRL